MKGTTFSIIIFHIKCLIIFLLIINFRGTRTKSNLVNSCEFDEIQYKSYWNIHFRLNLGIQFRTKYAKHLEGKRARSNLVIINGSYLQKSHKFQVKGNIILKMTKFYIF